jgi:hypothetical protein
LRHLAALLVFLFCPLQVNATLITRFDGLAYYDDVLNITWLADAGFSIGGDGLMTWHEAQVWLGTLNTANYLDVNTWRLPTMDVNGDAYLIKCSSDTEVACRDNELGYMTIQYGISPTSPGLFSNVGYNYWSSTDYDAANIEHPDGWECNVGPSGNCAWRQGFSADSHNYVRKVYDGYTVWAVASGDVALVPLPATPWLFLIALGGWGILQRVKS